MSEWHPIETAPHHRSVLGWAPATGGYRPAHEGEGNCYIIAWVEASINNGFWSTSGLGRHEFTHWMPLPEGPK